MQVGYGDDGRLYVSSVSNNDLNEAKKKGILIGDIVTAINGQIFSYPAPTVHVFFDMVNEARSVLRERFVSADVGITGANFLVAETGANVIVTNEGNGDLTSCLPRVHIVTAGIEKIVPSLDDLAVLLRVLARSATGQEFSAYTSLYSGPRRPGDM